MYLEMLAENQVLREEASLGEGLAQGQAGPTGGGR